MLKKFKKIGSIVYWLIIAVILLAVTASAVSTFEAPGGYRMLVVLSGSMEPSIKTGSMVLVAPQQQYIIGDVITYLKSPGDSLKNLKSTITHRIVEINHTDESTQFKTKGDANEDPDMEAVLEEQVLGKTVFTIPVVGKAIAFTRTQLGFTLLVVVPITIIIYHEVLNIKNEIIKTLEKRERKKEEEEEKEKKKKNAKKKTKKEK